jgi:hypothetical protein
MSIFKVLLELAVLSGCAAKIVPPSPSPAPAPSQVELAARNDSAQLPHELFVGHEADEQMVDIDSAVAAIVVHCDAVQLTLDIPVACQVDVVGQTARMRLTMANQAAAQRYLMTMFRELAQPFCALANREAARAGIVVSLYEEHEMQVVDCLNGKLSDWQQVDRKAQ